jgi:hypothetical protein
VTYNGGRGGVVLEIAQDSRYAPLVVVVHRQVEFHEDAVDVPPGQHRRDGNVVVFLASGKADYMTRPPPSSTGVCRKAAWVCDPRPPETGTTK